MKNNISKTTNSLREITFIFIDSLGNDIDSPITLSGEVGEEIPIPWKKISGYILSYISNFQSIFAENMQQIKMIYTKQNAAPIIVYHRDTKGNLLYNPEFLTGKLNTSYRIKPLKNYPHAKVTSNDLLIGVFSDKVQQINLQYDNMNLEDLTVSKNSFLKLKKQITPFKHPFSNDLLTFVFPINTTWKIYKVIRDKIQGKTWISLGVNIWLPLNESVELISEVLPIKNQERKLRLNYQVLKKEALNQKIFLSSDTTLWSYPYGDFQKNINNYTTETIILEKVILDNNSSWYKLSNNYYVEAKYIEIDD